MNLIAVEGCTLTVPGGTVTVIPASSVTNPFITIDSKKTYHSISFTAVVGDYTGGGTITGSTTFSKGDNVGFVVQGDKVTVTLNASHGRTMVATITVTVAGQTSTSAE